MLDRTSKPKQEVEFHLQNIKSLLNPPVKNTTKRKKIIIKNRGVWGVK